MNEKNIFLEKTARLFLENGAKTLTMDDIAKAFSISKKTLYQHYSNKEILLDEVLKYLLDDLLIKLKEGEKKYPDPIDSMLIGNSEMEKICESSKSIFIKQLIKYYPDTYNQHILDIYNTISEVLISNIEKGRNLGLYKSDFDEKLYSKYFLELMFAFDHSPLFDSEDNLSRSEFCQRIIIFYLNAIVTPKGLEKLNQTKKNF